MTEESNIRIEIGSYDKLGVSADSIRYKVFINEQGVPDDEVFDELNISALHIVVFINELPVATARVIKEATSWQIGLVAVNKEYRSLHLGEKVMTTALQYIASHGGKKVTLSAQQYVQSFYEKFGFKQCGEPERFDSGFVLVPMKYTF